MGVRFHRSVKIAKGVRLNISKTGLGVSLGPRGAKVSLGPRGIYSNIGVPGTGLYVRNKINGSANEEDLLNQKQIQSNTKSKDFDVQVSIDDETGIEEVMMLDHGREVKDASLIRKLKADPMFKERLTKLRERTHFEIEERTRILVQIHKFSQPFTDWEKINEELNSQKPNVYERQKFNVDRPTSESVYKRLEDEAYKTVKSIFGLKKKRKEYIDQRLENYLEAELIKWKEAKEVFEKHEDEVEVAKNNRYQVEFDEWKKELQTILHPDVDFLTQKLDQYFSEIQLPVEFSVSFEVLNNGRKIYLDIDLPEIEDFPQKKSQILSTGKLSVKNKSLKEKKIDYLKCVTGMSIYFASIVFSISPIIEEVIVSGYTQRINKATGNVEDEYVYSVKYDSKRFSILNIDEVEPDLTLKSFEHRIEINSQYDLGTVEPFD